MRQKRFGLLCAVVAGIIMVLPGAAVWAESVYDRVKELSLQELFDTRGDWRAVVFEGNNTETMKYPVKLCFRKGQGVDASDDYCYAAQEQDEDGFTWRYQIFLGLETVELFKKDLPRKGLLFTTRCFGNGSDWRDKITIWIYDVKRGHGTFPAGVVWYKRALACGCV